LFDEYASNIGIEVIHKIRKGQFDTSEIRLKEPQAEEVWQTVLAA
jgi:hypothetical protein